MDVWGCQGPTTLFEVIMAWVCAFIIALCLIAAPLLILSAGIFGGAP